MFESVPVVIPGKDNFEKIGDLAVSMYVRFFTCNCIWLIGVEYRSFKIKISIKVCYRVGFTGL